MSTLKVDSLVEKTSGNGVHIPGHVVQVVDILSTTTDGTALTTGTPIDVASALITPKSSGSKFVITATFSFNVEPTDNFQNGAFSIYLGSTRIQKYFSHYFGNGTGSSEINDLYFPVTHTVVYEPSYSIGDTLTFVTKIESAKGSGSVGYPTLRIRNSETMGRNRLMVQEIAQ